MSNQFGNLMERPHGVITPEERINKWWTHRSSGERIAYKLFAGMVIAAVSLCYVIALSYVIVPEDDTPRRPVALTSDYFPIQLGAK